MSQILRSLFIITCFASLTLSSLAQTRKNDRAREHADEFRQRLEQMIENIIDEIDAMIETHAADAEERSDESFDSQRHATAMHADEESDSTKKVNEFRRAQIEYEKQIQELKEKASQLKAKINEAKVEDDRKKLDREVSSLQKDIVRLEKRLDKLRIKEEKSRQSIEKRFLGNSESITRVNDDFKVDRGDIIIGDVLVTNGDVRVAGTIRGKLVVTNGDVLLDDSARVEGDLVCINGDLMKSESAVVTGRITQNAGSISILDENDDEYADSFYQQYPNSIASVFPLRGPMEESFLRYNRVEGLYIGFAHPKKVYWVTKPILVHTSSLGYGFSSHTWRYSLGLYKPFYLDNQIIEIGGEGHSITDSKDQWIVGREENTVMSFFAREDFMDYFTKRGFSASLSWFARFDPGIQTRVTAAYLHDTYRSMNKEANWSLFGGSKVFRENPQINEANINSIVFTGGFSTVSKVWRQLSGWDVQASYEIAGGSVKGDFQFTQTVIDVRRYQPLGEHVNLNVRGRLGLSDGMLPIQRTFELGGISTLPGYRYKEFGGSQALLANGELHVNGTLFSEAEGFPAWILRNVNLIIFGDVGVTDRITPIVTRDFTSGALDVKSADAVESLKKQGAKSDVGIAIGSSDGDFRIGMAWRLDEASSPHLVLRFSRPF